MPDKLTTKRVQSLIAAGVAGDHRDAASRGLTLRVKGGGVWTWTIRRQSRGLFHRLDLGRDWTLDEARDLASEADRRARADMEPWDRGAEDWARLIDDRRRDKAGLPEAERAPRGKRAPPYMWSTAVDAWHQDLLRTRREATAYSYRMCLNLPEFRGFGSRRVGDVTRQELAEAVAAVHRRGAETQAEKCVISLRSLFKFLGRDERTRVTGVEKDRLRDLEAPERTRSEAEDAEDDRGNLYVPDGPAVGLIARALADPERYSERDRLAGMLLLYTVQRRRPVALARKREFEAAGDLGGLWRMPPLQRKTASIKARRAGRDAGSHVVPLPPQAWAVVRRAMEIAGDSPWLFPGSRSRRAGLEVTSMHPSRVTEILSEIPGNLASPHDVRRAFATTYAGEARLPIERIKEVLDHNEGFASGDVTREHYSFLSGEHEKWPTMIGWCAWVDRWAATRD